MLVICANKTNPVFMLHLSFPLLQGDLGLSEGTEKKLHLTDRSFIPSLCEANVFDVSSEL